MLQNAKQRKQDGFTIIEVLIVLAIAGLIMLIVFLAVPALQRNSRNTQRKNDVASYMGAINEWSNNNNGKTPKAVADLSGTNGINSLAKLGVMTEPTTAPLSGAQTAAVALDSIQVVHTAKCSTTTVGQTVSGPARAVAIRYAVESSSGDPVPQCTES